MSKNVKKTLAAALTVATATGSMSIPAFAAENNNKTNVDDLYKAAYEATVKTQDLDTVTQADVNAAREAIAALKETSAADAIPTFSAIVDKAQQKFLETSYNLIVKCQKTEDQKDINAARASIQNLPAEFKNPYSMAIDVVQQKKIDIVYAAVQEAIKTQKKADVEKAQNLINDLKTVVDNDGVKDWVNKLEVTFKDATKTLDVVSANAQNNSQVQVVFNRPVDAKTVTSDDFAVTAKDGNNVPVGAVKVSEDGMTATINVLNNLTNKENYTVTVNGIKDTFGNDIAENAKASFDYEIAAVKSIEFTATDVPTSANLKNYVVIKDAKGRDVTNEYKNKLTFTASKPELITINGSDAITASTVDKNNNKVVVGVVVNGTDIKTSKTLTITDSAATQFDGYAIVNKNCDLKGKTLSTLPASDKLGYVTVGQNNVKVIFGYKDAQGNELELTNTANVVVEQSYNPSIAVMDNDGTIHAYSEGTAYFKVKYGDIERTISVQVKAASLPATIATSSDSYNLVATNTAGININYTINNQYGSKYNGNNKVFSYSGNTESTTADTSDSSMSQMLTRTTVKNANGEVVTGKLTVTSNPGNGQISIVPSANLETGTYTLTLERKYKFNGEDTTIDKNITVNVVNGGQLANYKVQVDHTTLNANPGDYNTDGISQTAKITVYEMDSNGNELGLANPTFEILDSNGNQVSTTGSNAEFTINGNVIKANSSADTGTYTVNVRVGEGNSAYLVKQITIKVVKTSAKISAVQFNGDSTILNVSRSETKPTSLSDLLNAKHLNPIIKDQYGNTINGSVALGDFTVANTKGVNVVNKNSVYWTGQTNNGTSVSQGSFDLVIDSLKVTADKYESKTIYYNTPKVIHVTVNPEELVYKAVEVNIPNKELTIKPGQNSINLKDVQIEDQYGNKKAVTGIIHPLCLSKEGTALSEFPASGQEVNLTLDYVYVNGAAINLKNKITGITLKVQEETVTPNPNKNNKDSQKASDKNDSKTKGAQASEKTVGK